MTNIHRNIPYFTAFFDFPTFFKLLIFIISFSYFSFFVFTFFFEAKVPGKIIKSHDFDIFANANFSEWDIWNMKRYEYFVG